ncbi:MAG TPA: hypothetical protein PK922_11330 [Syntrophorhabdus sp.]|nr:hypothetical protein [Syntrophorhabdus sp.]
MEETIGLSGGASWMLGQFIKLSTRILYCFGLNTSMKEMDIGFCVVIER